MDLTMRVKTLYFVLFIIIGVSNLWGQEYNNLSKAKEPSGFRGIKWGTNLQNNKDMILVSDYGEKDGRKIFKRKNEKLSIGPVKIDSIEYICYRDQFFQTHITMENPQLDRDTLKDILIEAYGSPVLHADMYIWKNDNLEIVLFPGGVIYDYKPIQKAFRKEYDSKHRKHIREGVDDL